ncbi:hypothetical protein NtRootA4_29000 [Arthrobacter sp. NtRootA4]|nr:hypothetical protein NtRootA2_31190 [Arthrobacter sp. NtRootA2]BCW15921.1 hypothetical protein NtRootA4_29000 [Arthrobacter sp. NtRootA4]BCW24254.1 hypothetical protein NtRootC7_31210 [Arthrobacter sp. NtRootC7]BCW28522.1 hypothetical protein NtRootC45_31220 [Arthrobacter sp. NtRootC45]BCW32793.1 hypothetical protein NtRootD5_31240 [Arthrobacter sp. NtRootD5]
MKKPLIWRIALTAYLLGLATVGFWPSPVDRPVQGMLARVIRYLHVNGWPSWFDYHFIEASANVVLFIPFGILAALALPRRASWQQTAIGFTTSMCMEIGQMLFIPARFSSLLDVVTNTVGTVIGVGLVRLLLRGKTVKPTEERH